MNNLLDHMYVYDNIAVFPFKFILNFKKCMLYLQKLEYNPFIIQPDNRILFVAVNYTYMINVNTFDNCDFFGFAVANIGNLFLENLTANNNDNNIKIRILDVVTNFFTTNDLYTNIIIDNPNFDVDVVFLTKYGFRNPQLINSSIILKYMRLISPEATQKLILNMVASIAEQSNICTIKIFLPIVVANTLSKYVKYMNESSGVLSVVKYNNDGVGILGLNSNNIIEGTIDNVESPHGTFVFHTHPDNVTTSYDAFISWPSGQDLASTVYMYLNDKDQLAHFVVSPEGIWIIHITPEFQTILLDLKKNKNIDCGSEILESIRSKFTEFDNYRNKRVNPIERHLYSDRYTSTIKNYKISNLFSDIPKVKLICNPIQELNFRLFNVNLVEWETIFNNNGVELLFTYISDPDGGLICYIR